jgi:hypothetical protein
MKKLFAISLVLLLLVGAALAYNATEGTWTGWVSDMKCGAKVEANCAKKCIAAGEKAAFVNDADKSVIPVANAETLKGHEGHHVKIQGSIDNNTLTVSHVEMLKDQKTK